MKKETVEILQKLSIINDEQVIQYPYTVISNGSAVACFLDIEKHEDKFEDFGIHSVSRLSNIMKQFQADKMTFLDDGRIQIENVDLDRMIQFPTTKIELLRMNQGKPMTKANLDNTLNDEKSEKVLSTNLTEDILSHINGIVPFFPTLSHIRFNSIDNEISAVLVDDDEIIGKTNSKIGLEGIAKEDISFRIKLDTLAKLPKGNWKLDVRRGLGDKSHIMKAVFFSEDIEGLTIIMAASSKL